MKQSWKLSVLLLMLLNIKSKAQETFMYKQVDSVQLFMDVYRPEETHKTEKLPAIVFFFGGGWNGGQKDQFLNQATYLSKRGMVCFLVDYRVKNFHGTSPFESLKDAKSAIRYVRKNAEMFGIDPNKIVAAGGSAGGHLAASTALISGFSESGEDSVINCVPNALVLFNPVIDNGPGGYGFKRIGEAYKDFSPLHNIRSGAPPTIIFVGTEDALIPVTTMEYYKTVMEKVKSRCDLFLYEDQKHGFFNYRNFEYYKATVEEADKFLQSLGYIDKNPIVKIE